MDIIIIVHFSSWLLYPSSCGQSLLIILIKVQAKISTTDIIDGICQHRWSCNVIIISNATCVVNIFWFGARWIGMHRIIFAEVQEGQYPFFSWAALGLQGCHSRTCPLNRSPRGIANMSPVSSWGGQWSKIILTGFIHPKIVPLGQLQPGQGWYKWLAPCAWC